MNLPGVRRELDFLTGKLSTHVQTLCFGGLAFTWLFISRSGGDPSPVTVDLSLASLSAGLLLLALVCDFLQYTVVFLAYRSLYRFMNGRDLQEVEDERLARPILFSELMFHAKVALMVSGILVIIGAIGAALARSWGWM